RLSIRGEQSILQQLRELRGCENLVRDAEKLFATDIEQQVFVVRSGRFCVEVKTKRATPRSRAAARATHADGETRGPAPGSPPASLDALADRVEGLEAAMRALHKAVQDLATLAVKAAAAARAPAPAPSAPMPTLDEPPPPAPQRVEDAAIAL